MPRNGYCIDEILWRRLIKVIYIFLKVKDHNAMYKIVHAILKLYDGCIFKLCLSTLDCQPFVDNIFVRDDLISFIFTSICNLRNYQHFSFKFAVAMGQ